MALDFIRRTDLGKWVQEVVDDVDAALVSARQEVDEEMYNAQLVSTVGGAAAQTSIREAEASALAQPGHELHGLIIERRRRHLQQSLYDSPSPDARTLLLRPELALLQKAIDQLTTLNRTSDMDREKFLHVSGPSGCGKSTLLRLLALVQRQRPTVYVSLSRGAALDDLRGLVGRATQATSVNFEPLLLVDDLHLLGKGDMDLFFREALATKGVTLVTAASSPGTKQQIRELPAIKKSLLSFSVNFVPLSSHLISWVSQRYGVEHVKAQLAAEVCGGLFGAYKHVFGEPVLSPIDMAAYTKAYTTYIPSYRAEHDDILALLQRLTYVDQFVEDIATKTIDMTVALKLLYLDQNTDGSLPSYAYFTQGKYYPTSPPLYALLCRAAGVQVPFMDEPDHQTHIQNKFVLTIEKAAAGAE